MRRRCVNSPYTITAVFGNVPGYPLNNGFHTGVDYVSTDKIIYAPMDSIVSTTGHDDKNGNYLVLDAYGYRDWFSHISNYKVTSGAVKAGQPLAVMGETGAADGVHVHHSLRVNGVLVDAEKHITEDDMITKEDVAELRIGHSEIGGWPLNETHRGDYDSKFLGAWVGKPWKKFIFQQWTDGTSKRNTKYAQLKAYPGLVKSLTEANAEIARLKASQADSSEANLLGQALIKLLATFGYRKA